MGWFNRRKTYYKEEMRACLNTYKLLFIQENPHLRRKVKPIFSIANINIKRISESKLQELLSLYFMNIEWLTLNILHHLALLAIQPRADLTYIFHQDSAAYELYSYINEIKLERGYIDKQEYDENGQRAIKAATISPCGDGKQSMLDVEIELERRYGLKRDR